MKLLTILLFTVLANLARAQEQPLPGANPFAEFEIQSGSNIHFEFQIISAPTGDVLQLVDAMQDAQQMEGAAAKLQAMLGKGDAKLVSLLILVTKPTDRAVVEDIDEIRYPLEFEPARLAAKDWALVEGEENADPAKPPQVKPAADDEKDAKPEAMAAMASNFETRNAGTVLELEPQWDPRAKRISVHLSAQRVFFAGMEKHKVTSGGQETIVEQPRFETQKVSTQLTLGNGQRVLLGTFKSREKEGWLDLFLLRGTVRPVPSN